MTPRVAVIGAGHWGRNLMRNFDALGALTAFYDDDTATRAREAAAYPNARAASSLDALLADPAIDAVVIATPAATHSALGRRALEAGKHTFVEKPLCLNAPDAEALGRLADRLDRTLMVGHLLLFHPAFVALKRFLAESHIGELRYIYSNRASLGRIRREGGALWEFAPHDVSMILGLTGVMPERVTCVGGAWLQAEVADLTLTHLAFPSGVQAHIFVSWLHPYKDHRMVVIGANGMVVFDDVASGPQKLLHYPHVVDNTGDIPAVTKAAAIPIPYDSDEPLARECRHFLDCVSNRKTPLSDWREGHRVLAVLQACQRALNSGGAAVIEALP
ncbi:MAG: Gfo/Idh/MocA family oxidoreductase [Alphaproteobacteria bacterium]|nr:Gfo/Idh/MocA family oxidoreductase [Alphaproteobacteria bacterium]